MTGAQIRQLAPAFEGSALTLSELRMPRGSGQHITDAERDSLLFAFAGAGTLAFGGDTLPFAAGTAGLVLAGEEAQLDAESAELAVVCATIGSDSDRHAPLGPRERSATLDSAGSEKATDARSFQILFGPHNGSTRATLFAGFIPPGKAPWHYHLYDEIVWVPTGPGRLHIGDSTEELGPGSTFRLAAAGAHRGELEQRPRDDRDRHLHARRKPVRRVSQPGRGSRVSLRVARGALDPGRLDGRTPASRPTNLSLERGAHTRRRIATAGRRDPRRARACRCADRARHPTPRRASARRPHHGNGSQAIFWERDDVFTGSVHVDPAHGRFPHFSGVCRRYVARRSGAVVEAARAHGSEALVVPVGVDAAADDPNAPLAVTRDGFRESGRLPGALGLPSVFAQEGGNVLDTIGQLVRATLEGFDAAC